VRLLLDAHVSGRRIGAALREHGHDVVAVDEERALDGCPDEELLALAAAQQRILVTFDAADFPRICRAWLEAGRPHRGCAVVVGIRQHEFGAALRALHAALTARPDPEQWRDLLAFVSRSGP
jgi:predicted nuclease of predicted toxin-antitoxin system